MKKETYYFSHDLNARNDPKILILRSVFGMEGYGRYWVLIEMMREQADFKIMLNKYIWNALALQMQCTADAAQEFVEFCINEACLLASDGEFFWSPSLLRRMGSLNNAKNAKTEQAKKAAKARWGKGSKVYESNADDAKPMQEQCVSNAVALSKNANEMKLNEINSISTTTTSPYSPPKGVMDQNNKLCNSESNEVAEVFKKYSDNIHPVTGEIEVDKLNDLLNKYGKVWLIAAIERAVNRNGRSLGYIEGILRNWGAHGFDDGGGVVNGTSEKGNNGVSRQIKKHAARREKTDWSSEPDGLPPL